MFRRCFFYLLVTVLPCFQATFKCPSLFNFYPDVHDCSKFYRCIWGKGATFNCPSGTLWSQDLLTCNHAKEVKCDKPSVSEEMKDFEAPDFSVDIKKSKGSQSSDDDGEDSNDEDNKADSWSDSKEDPHKNHKHTKEDSYYTNYDTDYGDSGGFENKGKKDNAKLTHQKMTNGQYKTAPESQEYHHVISHIPQPQHFVHHFQPTPYVLPAPQEYKSSVQLPQQYLSGPHQYQNVALPPHYQSAPLLQQYHAGPLHQQYHGELPPLSPPSGYILAPPNYVFQAPKSSSQEGEKSASMTLSGKAPPLWYNRNYLYNKLVQVPQLGAHYYSPYVVNTDGTYDVVKVDQPSPEPEELKLKPQTKPGNQHKLEPQIEKPPTEEDPWKETDLFRAGYGYKLIYHK